MIIDQRHMKLDGKAVISHFVFKPPLVAASDLDSQGCFIFPVNTEATIYRQDGKTELNMNQGVLMKCGTYVNKWNNISGKEKSEVVILRLFPEMVESVLESKMISKIKKKLDSRKSTAVVELDEIMKRYLESLFFYFDHPRLVDEDLVNLKINELLLLLVNIKHPNESLNLLYSLFNKQKFNLQEVVDIHLFENLSLDELASLVHMSTPTFKRKFKQFIGKSPGQYIRETRLNFAAEKLKTTSESISAIAYDIGFRDPNYFTKSFRKQFEITPLQYRRKFL